jgi:plasmid maintenance system antidote protein VapI
MSSIISTTATMPHIGNLLGSILQEKRITKAELARMLDSSTPSVNSYLKAASLQARIVWKLSIVLDYDFFEHCSNSLCNNAKVEVSKNNERQMAMMQQQIDDLQKAVVIYKDLLKK